MKFTKMQGIGNDYIYVNCFEEQVVNPEQLSVRLSDRRFGIGGDGLILIMPSQIADFKMRIFNADGSEAMMCGNGTRCIGKYVYEHGLTNKTHITLETNSGIKYLELHCTGDQVTSVTVDMGKAILTPREIPVESDSQEPFVAKPVQVGDRLERLTCVSVGNPHAVVFCDRVEDLDLEKLGPLFEHHAIFPDRVNTEFVRVIDDHTLQMRVWERGSGETLACGTGACATTVAAVLNGYCPQGEPILVKLRGGDLTITYQADGTVMMTGPAEEVFQGEINL
ncbi:MULTISPECIES: diaminopimelate epimerase [Ruminococcus]|uniref:Diaminopimelate epimerase n=1 Tax=Ruminococcus champanellensis (strain DSM 18848 / JCM 17042 / KCTC 15320 / 18P13) TaxID=213810 RepID=D4LE47_RUMC1|nr:MULTISPECIES: diaminopimelate epimerase [Ruminococcus]CBL17892.1 diaminopimelate epimerase [Ruminococcus champanellensis 18P13 = JCM 17042]CDD53445.1 diaminopimelate epimerase [Ruminococcus sp. CAG:379]